jgi:hypothetical protein
MPRREHGGGAREGTALDCRLPASRRPAARMPRGAGYWIVSFRPAGAAFLARVSSSTPFSNFAALAPSSSSTDSVKLR